MKQHEAWQILQDKVTSMLFFGGGAGGGKSWLGCEWMMTNTFFYPESKWFIARKELKRLMGSTYVTFQKVLRWHKIAADTFELNSKYNYIINKETGARIDLIDASTNPSDPLFERFGSLEFTGGWSEEAPELTFGAIDILSSRTGRHMNKEYGLLPAKHLLTGNPSKGWAYKMFYKPWRDQELSSEYAFIQSLYQDNPHTAEEYGKQLSLIRDKSQKQRLMFGNWEYDDDPAKLIEYDAIIDMFTNEVEHSDDMYLIADIARLGGDRIVISIWRGLKVVKIIVLKKKTTPETEAAILQWAQKYHVPRSHILIDEDGIGGGVVDHIPGSKGFVANRTVYRDPETPDEKPNFRNLKAQCAYLLADHINDRAIGVAEGALDETTQIELIEELEQIKAKKVDSDAPLDLVPKEDIKLAIGRSPDLSDVFLMRMYFEIKDEAEEAVSQSPRRTIRV